MRDSKKNREYYRREHRWYDLTRPLFLYGRKELAELAAQNLKPLFQSKLLEIGCGTGYMENKLRAEGFQGKYLGIDISPDMLSHARTDNNKSLFLGSDIYNLRSQWDMTLYSYPLTLMKDWQENLEYADTLLSEEGKVAVVDFHSTNNPIYKSYMDLHGIGINQNTIDYLDSRFRRLEVQIIRSPLRMWSYFYGVWQKKN